MSKLLSALVITIAMVCAPLTMMAQTKEVVAYYMEGGVEHQRYCVRDLENAGSADKLALLIYAFSQPAPDSDGNFVESEPIDIMII